MAKDRTVKYAENTNEANAAAKTYGSAGWPALNRSYKSSLFAMLFSEKENLLELYNAINSTHYTDPEDLEVVTLQNAIYMGIKNDISCILDCRLSLYEHQATKNPNMPLRFLQYAADQYSELTKDANLFGTRTVQIPAPRFIVFYNGLEKQPDRQTLRLSDAYWTKEEKPALELEAVVLNINKGHNQELLDACKTLSDYSEYVARVRKYHEETQDIYAAAERAVTECIQEGILADFLLKNRAEVIKLSIYEFDVERFLKMDRKENYDDGYDAGYSEGRESGYSEGKESGYSEGRESGYSEGRETGYSEGCDQGISQGIDQGIALMKSVLSDYAAGMSVSEIAKRRNTTIERVEQIIG